MAPFEAKITKEYRAIEQLVLIYLIVFSLDLA